MTLQKPDYFRDQWLYSQMERDTNKNLWTQEQKDFYVWMSNMEEQMSEFGCGGDKE